MKAYELIQSYYQTFNERDLEGFLKTLHPEVIHDTFLGETEIGVDAFRKYMKMCFDCVKETVRDLKVLSSQDGTDVAVKFTCDGEYIKTVKNYPEARNQKYSVQCHAFFEIRDDLIYRVTSYFNENDWAAQLAA
jgi:steroid delta-isomerase-like uncharacterized protein